MELTIKDSLCEKCPNTKFFLVRNFPHSDQKKVRIGHFSRSDFLSKCDQIADLVTFIEEI